MVRNTSLGGDIIEEFLVGSVKHSMQPAIITLPVGGGAEEFVSHEGEEFIFEMKLYGKRIDLRVVLFFFFIFRCQ